MTTETEIKTDLQNRLSKHYSTFRTIKQNGMKFRTMPRNEEIPRIGCIEYDIGSDVLHIAFKVESEVHEEDGGNIRFLETESGEIVGIKILNARQSPIQALREELKKDSKNEEKKIRARHSVDLDGLVFLEKEHRKYSFFFELLGLLPRIIRESGRNILAKKASRA